jgi:hypothetical protein
MMSFNPIFKTSLTSVSPEEATQFVRKMHIWLTGTEGIPAEQVTILGLWLQPGLLWNSAATLSIGDVVAIYSVSGTVPRLTLIET